MEYRQIVAVTGLSGLYQLMSTKNDGAIVRSLADKSIKFVSARIHHITPLESIEIYTTGENVRLHEVLEQIKANDSQVKELNSKKDDKAIKEYFRTVLPNFDEARVYNSDIRKVLKWYELLRANDLLNFDYLTAPAEESAMVEDATVAEEPVADTKPKTKKAAAKKSADAETGDAEKPAKKAAKKKAEGDVEKPARKTAAKKKKEEDAE